MGRGREKAQAGVVIATGRLRQSPPRKTEGRGLGVGRHVTVPFDLAAGWCGSEEPSPFDQGPKEEGRKKRVGPALERASRLPDAGLHFCSRPSASRAPAGLPAPPPPFWALPTRLCWRNTDVSAEIFTLFVYTPTDLLGDTRPHAGTPTPHTHAHSPSLHSLMGPSIIRQFPLDI